MKAIITKYHSRTEHKPAYILAKDMDGNRFKQSMTFLSASDYDNHKVAAQGLMDKMSWPGSIVGGGINGGYAWVFLP